jgi:hypothetical protein
LAISIARDRPSPAALDIMLIGLGIDLLLAMLKARP